ncbi:MAG: ABC transporter permease [Erysipelotrichaceae bacterium]
MKILKILFISFVLFLMYFPLLLIALLSFNNDGTGTDFTGFTFKWYITLINDSSLVKAIYNTFTIAFLSTIISTILGTLSAIGINSLNRKAKKRMIFFNNVPILNADIVTGIFLLLIFSLIGQIIGIQYMLGFTTVLIAHVLFSTPYVVLSVLPKLGEMDPNLYDAALDLGCRPTYALRKVIIPSIKSGIFSGMLLAFTMSIDDFVISYFVSGATMNNFSIWLYGNLKNTKNNTWPKAYAYNTSIVIITVIGILIYLYIKNRKKGSKKNA